MKLIKTLIITLFAILCINFVYSQEIEIDTTFTYFSKVYLEDSISVVSYSVMPVANGYIVSGGYNALGIYPTVYLRKLNEIGETEWVSIIDDGPTDKISPPHGTGHIATSDNHFLLTYTKADSVGTYNSMDITVVKHDINGEVIWPHDYGSDTMRESPVCIAESIDSSGYVIAGVQQPGPPLPFMNGIIYVLKIDEEGEEEWVRGHSLIDTGHTEVRTIEATLDGGYILGGAYRYLDISDSDPFALKLDEEGFYDWHRAFGLDDYDGAGHVKELADSSLIFSTAYNFNFIGVPFYAKMTATGDTLFTKTHYGSPCQGLSLLESNGDGFIGYGNGNNYPPSTPYLVSLDANLDTLWSKPYSWSNSKDVVLVDIEKTSDGGFILCGKSGVTEFPQFSWVSKIDSLGNTCSNLVDCDSLVMDTTYIDTTTVLSLRSPHYFQLAPNPVHNSAVVSYDLPTDNPYAWLRIFNLQGLEVRSLRLSTSENSRALSIPYQMQSGIYPYVVEINGRKVYRGKLVVN